MKKEIPGHVVKTLSDVDAEIKVRQDELQQLIGIRGGLMELYEVPASLPMGNLKKQRRATPPQSPAAQPQPTAEEADPGCGRAPSADEIKLAAIMRTAPEPFTMESLRVTSGLQTKFITNKLYKFKLKGWLASAGRGEYKRTSTFPNEL